jgi:hypothetical protein
LGKEVSRFDKIFLVALLSLASLTAVMNIAYGEVKKPLAFWIVILGFILFASAKMSLLLQKKWISFGPSLMTERMSTIYRVGYWLMAIGILLTFT